MLISRHFIGVSLEFLVNHETMLTKITGAHRLELIFMGIRILLHPLLKRGWLVPALAMEVLEVARIVPISSP